MQPPISMPEQSVRLHNGWISTSALNLFAPTVTSWSTSVCVTARDSAPLRLEERIHERSELPLRGGVRRQRLLRNPSDWLHGQRTCGLHSRKIFRRFLQARATGGENRVSQDSTRFSNSSRRHRACPQERLPPHLWSRPGSPGEFLGSFRRQAARTQPQARVLRLFIYR